MKISGKTVVLVAVSLLLAAVIPAAAETNGGVPGLNVSLYGAGTETVATAVTDDSGNFILQNVADSGTYSLLVENADQSLGLRLPLVVTADVIPANVVGRVVIYPELAIGLRITAKLVKIPSGVLDVTEAAIVPPSWNVNSLAHSHGRAGVIMRGTALQAIERVTISTDTGSLSTTSIMRGDEDDEAGVAAAAFDKQTVLATLVPAGVADGTSLPVTILVEGSGLSFTFVQNVTIKTGWGHHH